MYAPIQIIIQSKLHCIDFICSQPNKFKIKLFQSDNYHANFISIFQHLINYKSFNFINNSTGKLIVAFLFVQLPSFYDLILQQLLMNLLAEFDGFKLYLAKTKTSTDSKIQVNTLTLHNIKSAVRYQRSFITLDNLPIQAKNIFTSVGNFIKLLEILVTQRTSTKDKTLIWIDEAANIYIKIAILISGIVKEQSIVQIQMPRVSQEFVELKNKIKQLEQKIAAFEISKNSVSKINKLPTIPPQPQSLLLQDKDKQSKKQVKQNKKNDYNQKDLKQNPPQNKKFTIDQSKVTYNHESYKIQVSLVSKSNFMSIAVSVHTFSSSLTYTGELNDIEIKQFLFQATKLKNSKQLFEEIKKNARKENPDTLKVNEKQNKLQILIVIPPSKFTENKKEENLFAEIDIKVMKQEHQPIEEEKSQKKTIKDKDFDKKSVSGLQSKEKIINNVRSSLLKDKEQKKIQLEKETEKSVTGKTKKFNTQKEFSEISFKTKKTVSPISNNKGSKDKDLDYSFHNDQSFLGDYDQNFDLSLNLSPKKGAKSAKGFLLNKQYDHFSIKEKSVSLKSNGLACILLSRKIPKKNTDFEFLVRIKKVEDTLIIGIASEQVGNQNSYMNQYFLGLSILNQTLYQSGTIKQQKFTNPIKQLKQNSVVKVKVNLKTQHISWYAKDSDISKEENWKVLRQQCIIPHFMQLKDLYPIVFLKKLNDKVEFILNQK